MIFGGEVRKDEHGERFVKGQINDKLLAYLASDDPLPASLFSLDEKHAPSRKDAEQPKTAGQKFYDVMQRNSVTFGEIGLRMFCAANMVFPFFALLTDKTKVINGVKLTLEKIVACGIASR